MIGDEGVGLYMMAVPTLVLVITLTQLGLPVAISKLVAEAEALGDRHKIKKILVVSLSITCTLSVLFTLGLILFAPVVAKPSLQIHVRSIRCLRLFLLFRSSPCRLSFADIFKESSK